MSLFHPKPNSYQNFIEQSSDPIVLRVLVSGYEHLQSLGVAEGKFNGKHSCQGSLTAVGSLQLKGIPEKGVGITAEELKQLREQANLDFHRIAMLDEQNQSLQVGPLLSLAF